jgi:Subtilase family
VSHTSTNSPHPHSPVQTAFPRSLAMPGASTTLAPERVMLTFKEAPTESRLHSLLTGHHLVLDDGGNGTTPPTPRYPISRSAKSCFVRTHDATPIPVATIEALQAEHTIYAVAPVYRGASTSAPSYAAVLPQGFVVRLAQGTEGLQLSTVTTALHSLHLSVHQQRTRLLAPYAFLKTKDNVANASHVAAPKLAALLANERIEILYETVPLVSVVSSNPEPIDSYYKTNPAGDDYEEAPPFQWDMKRIGARYAWASTMGSSTVKLYLFDQVGIPVNPTHPDFGVATNPGTITQVDADTGSKDTAGYVPSGTNADHGTQMAGIMIAGTGEAPPPVSMAGHAPSCPFTCLRADDTTGMLTAATVASAMQLAIAAGGPLVLCMGIQAGAAKDTSAMALVFPSTLVQTKLAATVAAGNIVVCVASGPAQAGDTAINYTFYGGVITPNLLICGGTSQGAVAVPSSKTTPLASWPADAGDDVWMDPATFSVGASRIGPELTVVAPAAAITTTTSPSGFVKGQNGTSLATAHVAGIAAQAWSAQSALTAQQIVAKIVRTAAKTFSTPYTTTALTTVPPFTDPPGQPVGSGTPFSMWNPQMGYGRVDASSAVLVTDAMLAEGVDTERAYMMCRSSPDDVGERPYSPAYPIWEYGDLFVANSTSSFGANLPNTGVTTSGSTDDNNFTSAVMAGDSTSIKIDALGSAGTTTLIDNYVYVRVVNRTLPAGAVSAGARGIRITVTLAAPSTSFMYPNDFDGPTMAGLFAVSDDSPSTSQFYGPLAPGEIYIARLKVPANTDLSGLGSLHVCALARVTAANDVAFARFSSQGSWESQNIANLMQRNLNIV